MSMKSNGSRFLRGQLWWFKDPLYQNKSNNISTPRGEACVRHDRPVLILQDESTFDQSLLAVPCSSTNKTKYDIAITDPEIQKSYACTYLRVDKVMPIDPSCLSRYMMTLDEETMHKLESRLARLIFPNLNYDWNKDDKVYEDNSQIRHVKSTALSSIKLYKGDIIDEVPNSRWNETLIKQFCIDYVSLPLWEVSIRYNISEVRCARLFNNWRDYLDTPEVNNYNRYTKWTPEEKIKLITLYYERGCKYVAEQYGLSRDTVRGYVSRFKDRHPTVETIEEVEIKSLPFPDLEYASQNVMWFANIISKTCRAFDTYHSIYILYKNKNSNLNKESFYTILRDCIYNGMMTKLGIIRLADNSLYVPELLGSDPYINTWKLLDICRDNLIPESSSDGVNLMKECHRRYGNKISIHKDVIDEIIKLATQSLQVSSYGISKLKSTLIDIFADPDERDKLK